MNRIDREMLALFRSEGFDVEILGGRKHCKVRLTKDSISFHHTYSRTPSETRCGPKNLRASLRRRWRELRDSLRPAEAARRK